MPEMARDLFRLQAEEYAAVEARLAKIEAKLMKWHREDDVSKAHCDDSRRRSDWVVHAKHEGAAAGDVQIRP
ncbi:hypothetical protein ACVWZ3_010379 [Bradyrhizobium sp. i1.3.6]